jgi:hypothetical protein
LTDVFIELVQGDALEVSADLAICGSGPQLKTRVTALSGNAWTSMVYPPGLFHVDNNLKRVQSLAWPEGKWKQVISVGGAQRKSRKPFHKAAMDALVLGLMSGDVKTLLLLPFRHEASEDNAFSTLFFIYAWHVLWKWEQKGGWPGELGPPPLPPLTRNKPEHVVIADQTSVAPFAALVSDWKMLERRLQEKLEHFPLHPPGEGIRLRA